MRSDIHKLFDSGLIAINEDYQIQISSKLKNSEYNKFDGKIISLPNRKDHFPLKQALKYHMQSFRGEKNELRKHY